MYDDIGIRVTDDSLYNSKVSSFFVSVTSEEKDRTSFKQRSKVDMSNESELS